MPKAMDITGMRFNHLVALKKADSRSGHTYWEFQCDCGKTKQIMKCHVVKGTVKSCGCVSDMIKGNIQLDFSDDDKKTLRCKICDREFSSYSFDTRLFCYDCSPRNVSVAEAHRHQKRALKHILIQYKGSKCVDCGYDKCDGALQFHHLIDKDFTLSKIKPNAKTIEELKIEADKCILLCANCHAKRHEITDVVGFVMHLPPIDITKTSYRECKICNNQFIPNTHQRQYCYNCSPLGASAKVALRFKKRAIKNELLKYKKSTGCVSCGYNEYVGALQFHHKSPKEKDFTISQVMLNDTVFNMDKMKEEADKCDVLCANCHAEKHYINDGFDDIE